MCNEAALWKPNLQDTKKFTNDIEIKAFPFPEVESVLERARIDQDPGAALSLVVFDKSIRFADSRGLAKEVRATVPPARNRGGRTNCSWVQRRCRGSQESCGEHWSLCV